VCTRESSRVTQTAMSKLSVTSVAHCRTGQVMYRRAASPPAAALTPGSGSSGPGPCGSAGLPVRDQEHVQPAVAGRGTLF